MDAIATKDRRIFARFSTSLPLQYISPEAHLKGLGQAVDISANGIGMLSERGLPLHAPLDVWVDVPDTEFPFHTKGEVAWVHWVWFRRYRIGVVLKKVDLMGISQTLQKVDAFASYERTFPTLSRWERIKLWCVYYKSVVLRAFKA